MSDQRQAGSTDAYHVRTAAEVVAALGTDADSGLTSEEVERRSSLYGPNELRAEDKTPPWRRFRASSGDRYFHPASTA